MTAKKMEELYRVWCYDGLDDVWIEVSEPVSWEKAQEIWDEKTENGKRFTNFYKIKSQDWRA